MSRARLSYPRAMSVRVSLLVPALAAALLSAQAPDVRAEYLSVSSRRANVREGPGTRRPVLWQAWRLTPFFVVDWVGDWAKVRDCEGDDGWVHGSLLADTPTVIVTAKKAAVRSGPGAGYLGLWSLEEGYTLKVLAVDGVWLKVTDDDEVRGWVLRRSVWGRAEVDEGST